MRKYAVLLGVIVLPAAGALTGLLAGPFMARLNDTVRLAEQVTGIREIERQRLELERRAEEEKEAGDASATERRIAEVRQREEETRTLETDAFRKNKGVAWSLYESARDVQHAFRIGGALLGAWCGLVLGLRFFVVHREERRTIHDINPFRCVACTRCYLSCPREHLRLKKIHPDYGTTTDSPTEPARVD